jgi:virginiamycin B lyase
MVVGRLRPAIATLVLTIALAACGGGVTPSSGSPGNTRIGAPPSSNGTAAVTLQIVIQDRHQAPARRGKVEPKFVSPSTKGLFVVVQTAQGATVARAAFNVSATSKVCNGTGSSRTCTASMNLPPSSGTGYTFSVTSYNVAPTGTVTFPPSAVILGAGSVAGQSIAAGASNTITLYLQGVIDGFSGLVPFTSLPADGSAHTLALVIDPVDFGNNPIVAGTKDPYANPITATVAESGSTGHALLSLNGGTPAKSVTMKFSTDAVALRYDGKGSPGYGAVVSLATAAFGPDGATGSIRVSPLFVSGGSAYVAATRTLNLGSQIQSALTMSELSAPGASTYAATLKNCTNVATAGAASGTRAAAGIFVTGGTAASASGCTIAISDGTSTVNVNATNATAGGGIGVPPAVTITEYPVPTSGSFPNYITAGSDGAMWFTECQSSANKIGRIPTTATVAQPNITEFGAPSNSAPSGITSGPDGALWFTEIAVDKIGRIPTSATPGNTQITEFPTNPLITAGNIATGSDGNLWFGSTMGGHVVETMSQAGQVLNAFSTAQSSPTNFAIGPDGAMWFTECGQPGFIGRIANGVLSEEIIPTPAPGSTTLPAQPVGIAAGSDGNMWFTDQRRNAIGKVIVLPNGGGIGAITEIGTPGTGSPQGAIVSGPDGALWFAQTFGDSAIGRIPTNATSTTDITLYETPTFGHPLGIAKGPDGNLWFTEEFGNNIGRLVIGSSPSSAHAKKHEPVRSPVTPRGEVSKGE